MLNLKFSSAVFLITIGTLLLMRGVVRADFTFGTGADQFTITTVAVGNAGNSADIQTTYTSLGTQTPGSVSYSYEVMKYEVTRGMVFKFNNQNDASSGSRDIDMDLYFDPADASSEQYFNPYRYNTPGVASSGVRDTLPASGISAFEAVQFVNWLNAEKGYSAAYNLNINNDSLDWTTWSIAEWDSGDTGYLASQPYRNSEARFFLMNVDEAYKAAFYDSSTDSYFDYATGSNTVPQVYGKVGGGRADTWQGTHSDSVVKLGNAYAIAEADQTGGVSPYGVMGITGSVGDMLEFSSNTQLWSFGGTLYNGNTSDLYAHDPYLYRTVFTEWDVYSSGFRVLYADLTSSSSSGGSGSPTVPEPSTAIAIGLVAVVGFVSNRRRRRPVSA